MQILASHFFNYAKIFNKKIESSGDITSKDEYFERILKIRRGEPINSDFIQIPDGQKDGKRRAFTVLERKGIFTKSSHELPADFGRRELTEYLQDLIGKRRSSYAERKRSVHIAYVTPDNVDNKRTQSTYSYPKINDYKTTNIPTYNSLRNRPNQPMFGDADVVVLSPKLIDNKDNDLYSDPNYSLLLKFAVSAITDPKSMNIPVVVDNRNGGFDRSLELISDAYAQGRLIGKNPFIIANNNKQLESVLTLLKDIKQRSPIIRDITSANYEKAHEELKTAPSDGKFTVFIGGGHANNSKRDLEDAKELGYMAASKGWRIVTGAGSIEGSMGSVHTGFIQYHLDKFQKKTVGSLSQANKVIKKALENFTGENGKYDAEKIIKNAPELLERLADNNQIPKNMFIGYSMQPLLEMESHSGSHPPAITYYEAGNRIRRLDGLLSAGNKIIMPGSMGTDEELEDTINQHIKAIKATNSKNTLKNNESSFTDGTPNDMGTIVIYNRDNIYDKVLRHYKLLGDDPFTETRKKKYNIKVVDSLEELKKASIENAESWVERTSKNRKNSSVNIAK
ncbi:MAG: hypothetical protein R3D71_06215 [Rickettsiales bacterium]